MYKNETRYALINGVLLDGTRDMTHQTGKVVCVEGGKIAAVTDGPVPAGYEPVDLAGTSVCRPTLLILEFFGENELAVGDRVVLRKAGDIIPEVVHDGITVSSTYIRTLVESGQMERAAEFLGHRHCLTRTVAHGCRFGRTIGIPTVNLTMPPRVLVPAHGVYITRVYLPDGRSFAGVTNVGTRPPVSDSDAVSVETFLLDFDGDLYGQTIRLDFCRRLRGEQKFDSLEALRQGIQQNIAQTRAYFRGEA